MNKKVFNTLLDGIGATTLSITIKQTLSIPTLSIPTLSIPTLSIVTLNKTTHSAYSVTIL